MDFDAFDLWIFDCDGVLLDSNEMKSQAFAAALAGYDAQAVTRFLAYQKTTFGMSRFHVMAAFFPEFLGRHAREGEVEAVLERFGRFCAENYPRQPVTSGTLDLLRQLNVRGKRAYIASGSEQTELRATLEQIGLADHFADIFGSPRSKTDLIGDILAIEAGADPQRTLFLGDATADYRAAAHHGLSFLQVEAFAADPEGMRQLREKAGFPRVETLSDISF
jgi:phosphoglycolate phosphatase-like HAD superfamily hydrolase